MPRPNKPREVTHEANLAKRIQHERDARGLTYDALARRMTDAGCPIQASAIFKIEKGKDSEGKPSRRRVTVDELMAFAEVFGVQPADLLLPPELALEAELRRMLKEYRAAVEAWRPAWQRVLQAKQALAERVADDPQAEKALGPILRETNSADVTRLLQRELHYEAKRAK